MQKVLLNIPASIFHTERDSSSIREISCVKMYANAETDKSLSNTQKVSKGFYLILFQGSFSDKLGTVLFLSIKE